MNNLTTIRIEKGTRERIAQLGSKGETYEQILNVLIDSYLMVLNQQSISSVEGKND